jgi:tetratricopeptide (TPR) repeat protein
LEEGSADASLAEGACCGGCCCPGDWRRSTPPARRTSDNLHPPWQRLLQGDDARQAKELEDRLGKLQEAGKWEEALKTATAIADLREQKQGKDHWQTIDARWQAEALRRVVRLGKEGQEDFSRSVTLLHRAGTHYTNRRYREAQVLFEEVLALRRKVLGEEHPEMALSYHYVAATLRDQGRYKEAEDRYRTVLKIRRKTLGEEHPLTGAGYLNVAKNLDDQGRYKEAEGFHQKALDITREALGEGNLDTATCDDSLAINLNNQGRYKEAAGLFKQALSIRRNVLGEEHPDTAASYHNVAFNLNAQGRYKEAQEGFQKALAIKHKVLGEEHPDTARSYDNLALNLNSQGRYKEAEEGFQKALAIRRKVLGEEHPDTAMSYNNVAFNLRGQGRYKEAVEGYQKALDICRKVHGEEHPDTATCYNNLADTLHSQGRSKEADGGNRKALDIYRKVLGEEHPGTATSYNNLAMSLNAQGKYKEAEEGFRKSLDICRKVLGEEHPQTALMYGSIAFNQHAQGRYKEAEEGTRKALDIRRKVLGEEHPDTAISYNDLALLQHEQGQYKEAEEGLRKALAIRRKVLGEEHPLTAQSCSNLALNLNAQGKYKDAEEFNQKALDLRQKILGEQHPDTACSYHNLACNLRDQGNYKEAEVRFRKGLNIFRNALGEAHSDTANSYNNFASNLHAQGRYRNAEEYFVAGAEAFLKARLHFAASGLERSAKSSSRSPLSWLCVVLARNGKPDDAWQRYEQDLGRGLWDDLSARRVRSPGEQAQQAELIAGLQRLDQLLEKAFAIKAPSREQERQREDLLARRLRAQEELTAFAHKLEERFGPVAGRIFPRDKIQTAIPSDTALVGWIDLNPAGPKAADPNGEHWAVLLRSFGPPVWERLQGSGPGGDWTDDDTHLPAELRTALLEHRGGWQRLAARLQKQRLGPLSKHLASHDGLPAVRHLVVLPSPLLAGVPVELIADGYTVSYAHSGTLFAYLRTQQKVKTQGLFALADPTFKTPDPAAKEPPLPPGGVLLTVVQPGSNALLSHLKPNDVLLTYNGKPLAAPADLAPMIAAAGDKPIPVTVWREGKTRERQVGPGKLGVVLASKPAPEAIGEQRRLDRRLRMRSGDDNWRELPGSRAEVASLSRLFTGAPAPLVLTDSDASEQKLYELAQSGELKKYRYLHLATHGDVDDRFPLRSAVILSRDNLPDATKQLLEGKPVFDGRLTAEEVLQQWNLDCDLVTLSACRTALGKYERGEGFVGFGYSLVLCGSRSVCLSLWDVDDVSTAMLMQRFYANLLGKREGLKAPLGKAEALAEAKHWLRTLPRAQALKHAAAVYSGIERGKGRPKLPSLPPVPEPAPAVKGDCPYAHPYFWAAFILTGDPD